MLISVSDLESKWGVTPEGVLHVGAHEAEEWPSYKNAKWLPVYWIEAQEKLALKLRETLPQDSNQVYAATVWSKSNLVLSLNISSNGQSSSLLEFGSHATNYPTIQNIESVGMRTVRIDELMNSDTRFDFVNLDIQGAELEALKGMGTLLKNIKWIYCEVNSEETYLGCPHVSEIDEFLKRSGFIRVYTVWVRGKGWGDALYMQRNMARKYLIKKVKCDLRNYLGEKKYRLKKLREKTNLVLVQSKHRNWILDHIAKDLSNLEKCDVVYVPSRKLHIRKIRGWLYIPRTTKMIIFHQDLFVSLYKQKKIKENTDVIVFYTHSLYDDEDMHFLAKASKIIVMSNQASKKLIERYKVPREKIQILLGGVDSKYLFATPGGQEKTAIFVCDYKERKRPDLILRTVTENADWKFILHGRNWRETEELAKLQKLKNFLFCDYTFSNSSKLYGQSKTFISLSDLEGGPLPAIEALICGKDLILTNTGFAQDLKLLSDAIQILDVNPTSEDVTGALERSLKLTSNKISAQEYKKIFDYENFLREISRISVG